MSKDKFIRVSQKTHQKLTDMGKKGETYDQIINRVLEDALKWSQHKEKFYWILHKRIPPLTANGVREILKELNE